MPFSGEWPDLAAAAADMQTATVLAHGHRLGIAAAAILIVDSTVSGERIGDEDLEEVAKRAGRLASGVLSP
jgi:uridine phosphorylase